MEVKNPPSTPHIHLSMASTHPPTSNTKTKASEQRVWHYIGIDKWGIINQSLKISENELLTLWSDQPPPPPPRHSHSTHHIFTFIFHLFDVTHFPSYGAYKMWHLLTCTSRGGCLGEGSKAGNTRRHKALSNDTSHAGGHTISEGWLL